MKILIGILVFFMLLILAVAGSCVYIGYRVKQKAHEFSKSIGGSTTPYTGRRQPCAMLSTSEAASALGQPVTSVEQRGTMSCDYTYGSSGRHFDVEYTWEHGGITMVNIGVGPANAKTITDHIAVLRPHAWIMLGHCAGLRTTQQLGDYVLAHGYVREDHVLDEELPLWVPIPPLAEIQPKRITIVACDPATLARDLPGLIAVGYRIERLTMVDLFPQTFHMETVVEVGRTPWSAADPLTGLRPEADEGVGRGPGVRPTNRLDC
jgi:hypothetical protein